MSASYGARVWSLILFSLFSFGSSKFQYMESTKLGKSCLKSPDIAMKYDCQDKHTLNMGELGSGKFGRVFACREKKSGDIVALKEIDIYGHGNDKVGFLRGVAVHELKVVQHLAESSKRNSGVVYGKDGYLYEDRACLTMDLVDGKRAHDLLMKQNADEGVIRDLFKQFLKVLNFLHTQGVSHNDVSLNNFMIEKSAKKKVKVIDFGLASLHSKDHLQAVERKRADFLKVHHSAYEKILFAKENRFTFDLQNLGIQLCTILSDGKHPCSVISPSKALGPREDLLQMRKGSKRHFSQEVAEVYEKLMFGEQVEKILKMPWFKMNFKK